MWGSGSLGKHTDMGFTSGPMGTDMKGSGKSA